MPDLPGAAPAADTDVPARDVPAELSVDDAIARLRERREAQPAPEQPQAEAGAPPEPAAEGEAGEPEPAEEADPGEPSYRVKVGGQEVDVPLSELVAGYQKARDYTHKTQQLGAERQALEGERAQLLEMQQTIAQVLEQVRPQLEQRMQPPDPALAESDPVGWIQAQARWQQHQAKLEQQAQLRQQAQAQGQAQLAQHLSREAARLAERIPGWRDDAQRQRIVEDLRGYATEQLGFTAQELQHAYDSRIVEAIWKARQWDALQGGRVQPQVPGGQRPVLSNGATAPSAVRRATSAFKSEPTMDNAVALIQARRSRQRPS